MPDNCENCSSVMFGGITVGEHHFCSETCYRSWARPGFCEKCMEETSSEEMGGALAIYSIGTQVLSESAECKICQSRIAWKWFCILIPLFPVSDHFRVLDVSPKTAMSRKLEVPLNSSVERVKHQVAPTSEIHWGGLAPRDVKRQLLWDKVRLSATGLLIVGIFLLWVFVWH